MIHTARRTAWVLGIVAALAGALAGAADLPRLAWSLTGVAIAVLAVAIFLSFRDIASTVRKAEQTLVAEVRRSAKQFAGSALESSAQAATRTAAHVARETERSFAAALAGPLGAHSDKHTKPLTAAIDRIGKQLDSQPYLVAELIRRYGHLIDDDLPMPVVGGNWAAATPTILFILDEVLGAGARRLILECGSGASTLWTAAALRLRGQGHVYTLEHDSAFGEVTRQNLKAHGLQSWATVVDAPLVQRDVPHLGTGSQPWYDLTNLPKLADVDLLFVDGPPGKLAPLARFPAVPQLLPFLADGALIVLDDTDRRAEREVVARWVAKSAFERPLRKVKEVGRSTVVCVGSARAAQ